MYSYDVAVLGGGSGGYTAAIRCAQYGLKTVLIEADELGGTCLNRGCIPTKYLLNCAELYDEFKNAQHFGINYEKITFDFGKMIRQKNKIVERLASGIAALEKAHGVIVIRGTGYVQDTHTIHVNGENITFRNLILATGAVPSLPPIHGIEYALTSDDVLTRLNQCPDNVIIIGGGVIGIEFASLFSKLGKTCTVLEAEQEILQGIDKEIVELLRKSFRDSKIQIVTSARVTSIEKNDFCTVRYSVSGEEKTVNAQCCIVCTGRKPSTEGIGLRKAGIHIQNDGYILVDSELRTNTSHIFAVGDVTGKALLAHVASAQGLVAAANCADLHMKMCYDVVPFCIYTVPEIACVGLSEENSKRKGLDIKIGRFHVPANGKAMTMNTKIGLVKLIVDSLSGVIYGAHIFAPRAVDMIAEICAVIQCEGTVHELSQTIHPHPTISECIMEAALDAEGVCCYKLP